MILSEGKRMSHLSIMLALASLLLSSTGLAYPVLLTSAQLNSIFGVARDHLVAIKSDGQTTQRVALQVDEVEDDAALVLRQPFEIRKLRESLAHPQKADPFVGRLHNVHRIVLDDRDFASCHAECQKQMTASVKKICNSNFARQLLKVTLADSDKSLVIADCGTPVGEQPARNVSYEAKNGKVITPTYEYVQSSDKNIFFNEIRLKNAPRPILTDSEIKAYLKPKYLFNMKFKDSDLISQITSLSRGPQGLNIEVAVALNILAMKINTQICCDVSFYEDALYFPVVLDLPFAGSSFAKGSGLFFGFQADKQSEVKTELIPSQSPDTSDAILIQQGKNLITLGFRSPNKRQMTTVKPKVVSGKDMEKMKFMPVQSPSGIFYDIQNAQQGFQHFMVWMLFGQESDRNKLIDYAQHGARVQVERITNPDER